jgi:hypothetical protein
VSVEKSTPLRLSLAEEAQLRRLVNEAYDLRDGPYLRDACESLIAWHYRTLPDRLERAAKEAGR